MEIAQRSLETFTLHFAARRQQRLDQRDEVSARERLFEKMNRAQAGDLFALRRKVNCRQDDRARIGWLVRKS